jgi:Protoglobin
MAGPDFLQGFDAPRGLFGLDERARYVLNDMWPVIAPHLDEAIEQILAGMATVPQVAVILGRHRNVIKELEARHFQGLLGGDLGEEYALLCRSTVMREAAVGLDARMRISAGNFVQRAALQALARKHRFARQRHSECARVLSQVLALMCRTP